MKRSDKLQAISTIIESLLETNDHDKKVSLLEQLSGLLSEMTGENEQEGMQEFGLSGLLLPPREAADCLVGTERTLAYWAGVLEAIKALKAIKSEPIKIIYPGCGPFASLILPLLFGFEDSELDITLIEINAESATQVKKLINTVSTSSLKVQIYRQDALKFETEELYDLMVSECMLASLQHEGQVAITRHLSQFLAKHAVLIPERIEVNLQWGNVVKEAQFVEVNKKLGKGIEPELLRPYRHDLGSLIYLDKNIRTRYPKQSDYLTLKTIEFVANEPDKPNLLYTTRIQVFDNIWLEEYQNGLTYPVSAENLLAEKGQTLQLGFKLYFRPEFFIING